MKTINTEFNDKPSNTELGDNYHKTAAKCVNCEAEQHPNKDAVLFHNDVAHKTGDQKIPTRMFCQICGHLHKIDFWVPDDIWNEAIHPRWRDTHVCLNCFMERADERLLEWEKHIVLMPCSMATQVKIQNGTYEE